MKKLGFVGCGNMGEAMINRIIDSGTLQAADICVYDVNPTQTERVKQTGVQIRSTSSGVAENSEYLILSVKPQVYQTVCGEFADCLSSDTTVITIAPGQTLENLADYLGDDKKIIRTMPNAPAMVGAGMTGMCHNKHVSRDDLEFAIRIFNSFGKVEIVSEFDMDTVVAVSGSSPAYVCLFIESMADAAVAEGMSRAQAYRFAEQSVYGTALMLMETGMHPGMLKDMVCSPGGTTVESVKVLEREGLRSSLIAAMDACVKKARKL